MTSTPAILPFRGGNPGYPPPTRRPLRRIRISRLAVSTGLPNRSGRTPGLPKPPGGFFAHGGRSRTHRHRSPRYRPGSLRGHACQVGCPGPLSLSERRSARRYLGGIGTSRQQRLPPTLRRGGQELRVPPGHRCPCRLALPPALVLATGRSTVGGRPSGSRGPPSWGALVPGVRQGGAAGARIRLHRGQCRMVGVGARCPFPDHGDTLIRPLEDIE